MKKAIGLLGGFTVYLVIGVCSMAVYGKRKAVKGSF